MVHFMGILTFLVKWSSFLVIQTAKKTINTLLIHQNIWDNFNQQGLSHFIVQTTSQLSQQQSTNNKQQYFFYTEV